MSAWFLWLHQLFVPENRTDARSFPRYAVLYDSSKAAFLQGALDSVKKKVHQKYISSAQVYHLESIYNQT